MAIYLHHDGSVLANVFCSQLLCAETIVSYLTNNFVVWGWDITYPSNQNRRVAAPRRRSVGGSPRTGPLRVMRCVSPTVLSKAACLVPAVL